MKNYNACIEALNMDILDIIEKGIPSILDDKGDMLSRSKLNDNQKYVYQLNVKLKHILLCTLFKEEISKVHTMTSAK